MKTKTKIKRIFQLIFLCHKIHHIKYSYGWLCPLFPKYGYFPTHYKRFKYYDQWHNTPTKRIYEIKTYDYHDCTKTGVY